MALDLVTGYKGQNHVTAEQWADFNRGIYGDAAILPIGNKMQVEIQTANQITVKDGTGVFDGRQVYIGYGESENIAIESGTQQMLRHDIVVIKYTKDESSGIENVAFEVVTGVPVASNPQDPAYQDMDIRTGVFTSQKPFCRVRLNGVAIEGVDMLVEVKEFAGHAFSTPAANLTTSEPGRALDATMGKQLKEDVDELNQNMTAHKTSGDHDSRYYTKTQVNGMVFEDLGLFSNADSLDKTKFYKGVFQSGSTQYAFIQIPSVFSIQMIFLNTVDANVDRVGFRLATGSSFSGVSWSWLRNGAH